MLDYIRAHGQDSETLNVIYVVDEQGLLIDDIRIREFLLAPLDRSRRRPDGPPLRRARRRPTIRRRPSPCSGSTTASALPVTDTAGMLIGIVTIDDVLDVAEATATEEIQRIGGSEALDEPYMEIAFGRMIQKRAGWLTALFLGEMLTATAMGSFEAEIAQGGRAGAVRAAHHLERRQLRLAGVDARHPRAGARRGGARATGGA